MNPNNNREKMSSNTQRKPAERWIVQQAKNQIQRTLLLHAPERWHDDRLEQIEQEMIRRTKRRVECLTTEDLLASTTLGREIWIAEAETKGLIEEGKVKR